MGAKWLIHSGSEVLGPWSARQIRDELRSGRVDPFDLAQVDGAKEKRPLVEVDEIFVDRAADSASESSEAAPQAETIIVPEVRVAGRPAAAQNTPGPSATELRPPRAFEALAAPTGIHAPQPHFKKDGMTNPSNRVPPRNGGTVRRYLLSVPGQKNQGPFTSTEVLALWYGKKLPQDTIVQRAGVSKKIRIQSFASFYERAAPSGIAFVGEARLAAGAGDYSRVWLALAVIVAIGVIAGAMSWRYTPVGLMEEFNDTYKKLTGMVEGLNDDSSVGVEPGATGPMTGGMQPSDPALAHSMATQNPPVDPRFKANANLRGRFPGRASEKTPDRVKVPRRPRPVVNRSPVKPAVTAGNVAMASARAKPQPAPRSSTQASPWVDGATVTLAGYRFDINALNACELKCKIPMTGPKGAITAVFFKEALAANLAGKSSGVTVTGTVRKDPASGAISVFVQSAQ